MSFGAIGGGATGVFDGLFAPPLSAPNHPTTGYDMDSHGLLGTAFGLLDAFSTMQQSNIPATHSRRRDAGRRVQIDDEDDEVDDDLAYEDAGELSDRRPRSMLARLKDKIKQTPRKTPYSREHSPAQRSRIHKRDTSYHTEVRQPSWAPDGGVPVSHPKPDLDQGHDYRQRPQSNRTASSQANLIEALQNVVTFHADEVKKCQKQLERASRQRIVDSDHLQRLLNKLKTHETSLARAAGDLQTLKNSTNGTESRRQAGHHTRPARASGFARNLMEEVGLDDLLPDAGFGTYMNQPRVPRPFFADYEDATNPFANGRGMFGGFHSQFGGFGGTSPFDDDFDGLFAMPSGIFDHTRRKTRRSARPESGQYSQPHQGYPSFVPAPLQPPSTLLTPGEAKGLFQMYNDRWSALSQSDPNIPYPARGLHAPALVARDTLWAPLISAHPSTWSDEAVMQANVQAFFLNVFDLSLRYVEAAGRVEIGYDKSRATPVQVKQLVDVLKKEKIMWHSDRLGRRNGGAAGPNEVLQRDERARAVFHAVCELMEYAQ